MKKYLFILVLLYTNLLVAQHITDLKLYRNQETLFLLKEKDTVAIVNQLPKANDLFKGKVGITSNDNMHYDSKEAAGKNIRLNYSKRSFILDHTTYNFTIDYTQNILVLFCENNMILRISGRNLRDGISINFNGEKPDMKLICLAFLIKHDAKTLFIMKHSVFKIGALAAVVFSLYSLIYLHK